MLSFSYQKIAIISPDIGDIVEALGQKIRSLSRRLDILMLALPLLWAFPLAKITRLGSITQLIPHLPICQLYCALKEGKVVAQGIPNDVMTDDNLQMMYQTQIYRHQTEHGVLFF